MKATDSSNHAFHRAWQIGLVLFALAVIILFLFLLHRTISQSYDTVPLTEEIAARAGSVTAWFEKMPGSNDAIPPLALPKNPEIVFQHDTFFSRIYLESDPSKPLLDSVVNAFLCDLNGDSIPELCTTCAIGFGIVDHRICVYDTVSKTVYELENRGYYDYVLEMRDGKLVATKKTFSYSYIAEAATVYEGAPVLVRTISGTYLKIAVTDDAK